MPASHRIRAALAAFALVAASCGTDPVGPPATPPQSASAVLTPVAGADQAGRADRPLPSPLQVRVVRDGTPVAGVHVVWHTLDGSLEPSGVTDAEGLATAVWTLPPRGGRARASARLENDESGGAVFYAEARVPELRTVSGNGQDGRVEEALPEPLQVLVTWDGQPLAGEPVQWSFLSTPVLTGPDGIAAATWTLNTAAGINRATARIGRLQNPVAYFSATAAPGPVATLEKMPPPWDGGIQHWTHGSGIRFYTVARDRHGNVIGNLPVEWSLATGAGTSEGTVTDHTGMAYVDVTPAEDYAGDIQVRAAAEGVELVSARYHYAHFMFVNPTGWGDEIVRSSVTVAAGTSVRWAHYGYETHVVGPKGGIAIRIDQWGSGMAHSFTAAGVHEWICAVHDWEKFTIVVAP